MAVHRTNCKDDRQSAIPYLQQFLRFGLGLRMMRRSVGERCWLAVGWLQLPKISGPRHGWLLQWINRSLGPRLTQRRRTWISRIAREPLFVRSVERPTERVSILALPFEIWSNMICCSDFDLCKLPPWNLRIPQIFKSFPGFYLILH